MTKQICSKQLRHWPKEELPREKARKRGMRSLSDAELMALLLRQGVHGKDVVSLGRELLKQFGDLRGLLNAEMEQLERVHGLGPAKATIIGSLKEIVLRYLREEIPKKFSIKDPGSVIQYLQGSLRDEKIEIFKVLYLDKAHHIIAEETLSQGTVDQAAIYPQEVVRKALGHHASALILIHNHPSGRVEPSREDLELTRHIQRACETLGLKLVDHLIIGNNCYYSFCEHQQLK